MAEKHSMQVTETLSKGLKRDYDVLVPAAVINQKIEARLKSMGSRMKVPGFRPGNVPMKVLQQKYGKSVMAEVLEQTVNQSAKDAMDMKKLRPALPAKVEITDYKEGGELAFKMSVEVLPEIPSVDFGKINLERLVVDIPKSEVDQGLERLRQRNRTWKARGKDARAREGDVVVIDFTGKKDGEPFEGGAAKKFRLELGSGQFIPGFEEQLISASAGDEKVVKVTFPKDYHKEDLAGEKVEFDVTVHEIMEAETPAIDADFAKEIGFETVEELRAAVEKQIGRDYETIARNQLKKQLFDKLDEMVKFETPEGMIDLEFNAIWSRLEDARRQGDESLKGRPEDELKKEYRTISERRVRLGLLLSDVSLKNKIEVAKEELSRAILDQARMYPGQERRVVEFYQQNPQQVDDLKGPILEEKAVDFILDKIKVKDRKISIAELLEEDEKDEADTSSGKKSKPAGEKAEKAEKAEKKEPAKKAAAKKK